MGSKRKIAEDIIRELPRGEVLVDLFAGGCAITHCALLSGKWRRIIANDVTDVVRLFADAVAGKYHDERRWISREDFFRLKDADPYVRYCWSFGNNGTGYMYAPELERFKKWMWQMAFASTPADWSTAWRGFVREFSLMREDIARLTQQAEQLCAECNVEMLRKGDGTVDAERIKVDVFRVLSADIRAYMRDALKQSGHMAADVDRLLGTNGMAGHYFGASQWILPTKEAYEKMQTIMPALTTPWAALNERLQRLQCLQTLERLQSLESLERLASLASLQCLQRLQSLERLERLQTLESLQGFQRLTISQKDYRDVAIPAGAVVYCDPPYKDSAEYLCEFDHDAFYEWLRTRDFPVYVSEYTMPDDFVKVWGKMMRSQLSATSNSTPAPEGLYLHKRWLHKSKPVPVQLPLFDYRNEH